MKPNTHYYVITEHGDTHTESIICTWDVDDPLRPCRYDDEGTPPQSPCGAVAHMEAAGSEGVEVRKPIRCVTEVSMTWGGNEGEQWPQVWPIAEEVK